MKTMKHKAKMGRPPKPPAEKMSKLVGLKVTPGEYRRLRAAARKAGLSVAAYIMGPRRRAGR